MDIFWKIPKIPVINCGLPLQGYLQAAHRPGTSIPLPFLGALRKSLWSLLCLWAEAFYSQNIGSEIVDLAEH